MSTALPLFDHLPARWRARDAGPVLAALAASGLSAAEFARRTGITPKRLSRWGVQLRAGAAVESRPARAGSAPTVTPLVELVAAAEPKARASGR